MTQLYLKRYKNVGEFYQETREHLLREEVFNTFVFVTANKLQIEKVDPSTYYCSAVWDGTKFVIGVVGIQNDVLYISALYNPENSEVAEMLVQEAYTSGMDFKFVHGYYPIVDQVSTLLLAKTENKSTIKDFDTWSYITDKVKWSERDLELVNHGELRLATTEDLPILRKIGYQYIEDIGEGENILNEDTDKAIQVALDTNGAYLWVTKEEGPVGMAWTRRPLVKGISVAYVSILREYRHKGYGSVMVSTLTENLLKKYDYVTLFALISQNPNDNLYTRMGYRYIGKCGMPRLME